MHFASKIAGVSAVATLALVSQAAKAVIIDNYTDVQAVSQTGIGTSSNTVAAPGALGGSRFAAVNVSAGAGIGSIGVNNVVPNAMAVSSNAQVDANFDVVYGNAADLNADLTGTSNAFLVRVLSSDLTGITNTITVTTTGGGTSTVTFTVPGTVGAILGIPSPFDIILPYASFTGTASFADVDKINLDFNTPRNADWAIQLFGTTSVPEASSMGLLAPLGLLLARRRA